MFKNLKDNIESQITSLKEIESTCYEFYRK